MVDDRRRIAEDIRTALRGALGDTAGHPWHVADVATDALLPLIDRVKAEAAADELDRMADLLAKAHDQGPARRCTNRARALRAAAALAYELSDNSATQ